MKAKLRSKFVLICILSFIVVALVGVFAVPAIVSAAKGPAPAAALDPNKNFSRVQGTVYNVDTGNSTITIKANGTGSMITLTLDKNTNFAIHGNSWLDPISMVGEPVSAVYNNNSVAIQIAINMPAPPPMPPKPPGNKNISMVTGNLTVDSSNGTITIAPSNGNPVGPLSWNESSLITLQGATLSQPTASSLSATTPLKGSFTAIYNNKNQVIGLLMGNMPAPPPMPPKPLKNKNVLMVTGNLTVDSSSGTDAIITITPGHGKSVDSLTWNGTSRITLQGVALSQSTDELNLIITTSLTRPVCVIYDKSNFVEQIIVNMPRLVPGVIKPPAIFGGGGMPPKVQPPRWSLPQGKFR